MPMKFWTGTQFLPGGHVLLPWLCLIHIDFDVINLPPYNLLALFMIGSTHFPPLSVIWSFDIGKKGNDWVFLAPQEAWGLFSQNVRKFPPYLEGNILFAHNTHYGGIFSADTVGLAHMLYTCAAKGTGRWLVTKGASHGAAGELSQQIQDFRAWKTLCNSSTVALFSIQPEARQVLETFARIHWLKRAE